MTHDICVSMELLAHADSSFYVDGSTLPSQGDNDDDIITDDRKESSSASTIVGDQIKIMWMRPVDVPTNLGQ